MRINVFIVCLLVNYFSVNLANAKSISLDQKRAIFLLAEKAIINNDDRLFLKRYEELEDYPLNTFIYAQWLSKNLAKTKPIEKFLSTYPNDRYAGFLRKKWLIYLANHQQWKTFLANYISTRNTSLRCFYHTAEWKTGLKREAMQGAKKLWLVGYSQPKACDDLFAQFTQSNLFNASIQWERFKAAVFNGEIRLARYLKKSMPQSYQTEANQWLKVHKNPLLINSQKGFKQIRHNKKELYVHGIHRLIRFDLKQAVDVWDSTKHQYGLSSRIKNEIDRKIALHLASNGDANSSKRLKNIVNSDDTVKMWQIRTALRQNDWHEVESFINQLSASSRNQERWQYWLARSFEMNGKPNAAKSIFNNLSTQRSYFGYLSAEKLDKAYVLADHPLNVTNKMINELKQMTNFHMIAEFIAVKKEPEAKSHWRYAIRRLNKEKILTAAKYAQQLRWHQEAIITIAKAKYWDDVALRFPLDYKDKILAQAKKQNLDSAIIYGLIRRESAFNEQAKSPVGAMGLMQIMPKTGRYIAKQLKEKWRSNCLLRPETNLKYGTFYFNQLLQKFDGHYALAAAAYNAGPHRVKRWLPAEQKIAADIWVETIPYKETRNYVSAVLTYALIYQKQLNHHTFSMNKFMKDILPG